MSKNEQQQLPLDGIDTSFLNSLLTPKRVIVSWAHVDQAIQELTAVNNKLREFRAHTKLAIQLAEQKYRPSIEKIEEVADDLTSRIEMFIQAHKDDLKKESLPEGAVFYSKSLDHGEVTLTQFIRLNIKPAKPSGDAKES